ncbi:MAG: hypothetical protein R6V76_12435, partial [Desulfobacterales bacterium]
QIRGHTGGLDKHSFPWSGIIPKSKKEFKETKINGEKWKNQQEILKYGGIFGGMSNIKNYK